MQSELLREVLIRLSRANPNCGNRKLKLWAFTLNTELHFELYIIYSYTLAYKVKVLTDYYVKKQI